MNARLKSRLKLASGAVLTLFYPRRCPVCDKPVKPWNSLICDTCRSAVVYVEEPRCLRCGKHIGKEEKEYCDDCAVHPHLYNCGRALFSYESVSSSIARFKYSGRREYAAFYARGMKEELGGFIRAVHPCGFVPVPLHRDKERRRGYNQAEVLARELSALTGIPVYADLIGRVEKTAPMKDLSAAERQNNLKKAFKIFRNDVKLYTIIIIDDIYTTGSTIDAMSRELRKAGVERIYFLTLAVGKGV